MNFFRFVAFRPDHAFPDGATFFLCRVAATVRSQACNLPACRALTPGDRDGSPLQSLLHRPLWHRRPLYRFLALFPFFGGSGLRWRRFFCRIGITPLRHRPNQRLLFQPTRPRLSSAGAISLGPISARLRTDISVPSDAARSAMEPEAPVVARKCDFTLWDDKRCRSTPPYGARLASPSAPPNRKGKQKAKISDEQQREPWHQPPK